MPRRPATFLVAWLTLLVAFVAACGPATPLPEPRAGEPVRAIATPGASTRVAGPGSGGEEPESDGGDPGPIPVTRADPARGGRAAPVTLVLFSDFECPFCKRVHGTIRQLERQYSPAQLRVVWKNNPLPFHKGARPTAEAAMAVFAAHGPDAFWAFHDAIFDTEDRLTPDLAEQALRRAGVSPRSLERLLESGAAARKVDEDLELGKRIGVTGTPAAFINGVSLSGAQPLERFTEIIDADLEAARAARGAGTPAGRVYAELTRKNFEAPKPRTPAAEEPVDMAVHRVPVGDSPVRGKATALVTMVVFSDFQCPFCARAAPTVDQLARDYGDDLRVVWKDQPLSFHKRAEPAAELAREARAQKGDAAFWRAHDLLFAGQRDLEDPALEGIAASLQLDVVAAKRAVASRKHAAKIAADQELAHDVKASGTPHFFINGRRLVGAQPLEKFKQIIDEELVKAKDLVAKGTPRLKVYEAILSQAAPLAALPTVTVPAPGKANPRRGAAAGKVVVQVFSDFQCPFCARSQKTVDELVAAFPGAIQVVWRNLPLPFHNEAQLAAEAALEVHAQQGDAGFWKMHDLLFKDPSSQNLDRAGLERHAASLGLDLAKFRAALDAGTHRAAVDADKKIAEAAGINGTPTFVINGILVIGAQPLATFKKAVKQALGAKKK